MILNLEMKFNLVLSFCCRDLARDLSLSDSEDEENKVTYPRRHLIFSYILLNIDICLVIIKLNKLYELIHINY